MHHVLVGHVSTDEVARREPGLMIAAAFSVSSGWKLVDELKRQYDLAG